jgi:phosphoribosylglycinamide formyltransferase-1
LITRESQQMFNFALRMKRKRIALFISGNGSNARNIINYFDNHAQISVSLVLSSAKNDLMDNFCSERSIFFAQPSGIESDAYLKFCQEQEVDWVILAGFLKKIPVSFINAYPERIINIHPALLPSFGGKGMYGKHVHEAVSKSEVSFSGITIHLVNEEFDKGKMLAQFAVALKNPASALDIEEQVRNLEIKHFPSVIESILLDSIL